MRCIFAVYHALAGGQIMGMPSWPIFLIAKLCRHPRNHKGTWRDLLVCNKGFDPRFLVLCVFANSCMVLRWPLPPTPKTIGKLPRRHEAYHEMWNLLHKFQKTWWWKKHIGSPDSLINYLKIMESSRLKIFRFKNERTLISKRKRSENKTCLNLTYFLSNLKGGILIIILKACWTYNIHLSI